MLAAPFDSKTSALVNQEDRQCRHTVLSDLQAAQEDARCCAVYSSDKIRRSTTQARTDEQGEARIERTQRGS
jgi:hypothetical protein